MKNVTYECRKCGKACNGGGISFSIIEGVNSAVLMMSGDMDEYKEHACGEEHAVQTFSNIFRKIKGQVDKPVILTKEKEAIDVAE
jgi:hypothetical protein